MTSKGHTKRVTILSFLKVVKSAVSLELDVKCLFKPFTTIGIFDVISGHLVDQFRIKVLRLGMTYVGLFVVEFEIVR